LESVLGKFRERGPWSLNESNKCIKFCITFQAVVQKMVNNRSLMGYFCRCTLHGRTVHWTRTVWLTTHWDTVTGPPSDSCQSVTCMSQIYGSQSAAKQITQIQLVTR